MDATRILLAMAAATLLAAPTAAAQSTRVAPDVEKLRVTPIKVRALSSGSPVVTSGGSLVRFRLKDGAQVRFTFRKVKYGRRSGGKCRPGKAKSRRARCERLTKVPGGFTLVGISADNEFRFAGRVGNKTLSDGTYRMFARAEGRAARSSSALFKVVRAVPVIRKLKVTPTSFKVLPAGPSVVEKEADKSVAESIAAGGTLARFQLDEATKVTFTVRTVKTGRRVGRACRTGKATSRKARCEITKKVAGSFSFSGEAAANEFVFSGRIGDAALKPGTYRLFGKPAGKRARSLSAPFTVLN